MNSFLKSLLIYKPKIFDIFIYCLDTVRAVSNPLFGPIRIWEVKETVKTKSNIGKYIGISISSFILMIALIITGIVFRKRK